LAFPEYQLLALDADDTIIAKVHSVPFAWSGSDDDLSVRGLDAILERAFHDLEHDRQPTAASLVEARVAPDHRGQGLSYRLLEAARGNAVRLGFDDLFGPVRPSAKSKEPRTPFGEYVMWVRPDGLPSDPWLRAHVRLLRGKSKRASMPAPDGRFGRPASVRASVQLTPAFGLYATPTASFKRPIQGSRSQTPTGHPPR